MDGIYDIYLGTDKIGKAEVCKEGLYYRFRCCCNLEGQEIHRLVVTCGEKSENLGIPVPEGDAFYLRIRIPVSHFSGETPVFRAVPRYPRSEGLWVPIAPEMPFAYIEKLEDAVMERRDDQMGILIREEAAAEAPPDSGQSQARLHG
ncbi:MAG: hypothetical protein E7462_00970 [Ruminococcaceae bacterium]|nr:hypothetical protein [Oscillospiraceae bacterium]